MNAALLCLDYCFTDGSNFLDADITQLAQLLQKFFDYVEILFDLAFFVDPAAEDRVWSLLGIRYVKEAQHFVIHPRTFFHTFVSCNAQGVTSRFVMSREEFTAAFKNCLQHRLLERVRQENMFCHQAKALDPCLRHITLQDCDPSRCDRQHVLPDESWIRHWLMAHILQVVIYDSISRINGTKEDAENNRMYVFIFSVVSEFIKISTQVLD